MGLINKDILNFAIKIHGRSGTLYSRQSYSSEDGIYGNSIETYSTGTSVTVKLSQLKENEKWLQQGILTNEDCVGYIKSSQSINKDDKITIGSDTYYVEVIEPIQQSSVQVYQKLGLKRKNEG